MKMAFSASTTRCPMNWKNRRILRKYGVFNPNPLDFLPDECIPQKRLNSLFLNAIVYNQLPEASFYLKALLEGFIMRYASESIGPYCVAKQLKQCLQDNNDPINNTKPTNLATNSDFESLLQNILQIPKTQHRFHTFPYWINEQQRNSIAIRGSSIAHLISEGLPTKNIVNSKNYTITIVPGLVLVSKPEKQGYFNNFQDLHNKLNSDELFLYAPTTEHWLRKDQSGNYIFWVRTRGKLKEISNFLDIPRKWRKVTDLIRYADETCTSKIKLAQTIDLDLIQRELDSHLNKANNTFKHQSFSTIPGKAGYDEKWSTCEGLAGLYYFHVVPMLEHLHKNSIHN